MMVPDVAGRKRVKRLKQVVFPAPFGPINAWMVPRFTWRFTLLTATKPRNSLLSPRVSRITPLESGTRLLSWKALYSASEHDGHHGVPRHCNFRVQVLRTRPPSQSETGVRR